VTLLLNNIKNEYVTSVLLVLFISWDK